MPAIYIKPILLHNPAMAKQKWQFIHEVQLQFAYQGILSE